MNKTRELYYYFGRNEKHDYIAMSMDSCIVTGNIGRGRDTFLNSLLVRLIQETNPKELDISFYDMTGANSFLWDGAVPMGKVIPQFKEVVSYSMCYEKEEYFTLTKKLRDTLEDAENRVAYCELQKINSYLESDSTKKTELIIMSDFKYYLRSGVNKVWFRDTIKYLVENAKMTGIYLMLLGYDYSDMEDVVKCFPIRVVTPCSEDTSNLFIGCNMAGLDNSKSGVVYVKNGDKFPIKLYVPFYPDTWLRKFIGYYSVRS